MADMHNEWFAVAMNAAAALEDAANCLRDPDAKKSAMGAAEHIRARIRELDSRTAPADKQGGGLTENEFQHEEFDRMAEERYKVVPTNSGFWPYGVVAGDGERYLHIGHRKGCERVARSLAGAFCDGAFVAHGRAVLARVAPSAPVYDKSVVKRIATQMGWTPPSAQQAEPGSPMKAAADALLRKAEMEQAHQDGYRDGFKAAQAMLAKAEQPAEEARGVDGDLMEAIRRYAFVFALHTQKNTDASRAEADAALARVRALLAAPAAPAPTDLAPCIGQCGNAVLASGDRICHECREAAPAPAAQADEHSGKGIAIWLEDLRRAHTYLDEGKPFFTGKDCAELADLLEELAQQSATPAEPVYQEESPNGLWYDIPKAMYEDLARKAYRGGRTRVLYATPAGAASEADKREALAAAHEGDWHDMMSAYNRCPADLSHPDRMRWLAAEFRRLVSLRAIKQRERQQGAQSNG